MKEEALDNMALREKITCHPNVTTYYRKFKLDDGSVVVLDAALAFAQVKQCLNDLKRHGRILNAMESAAEEEVST